MKRRKIWQINVLKSLKRMGWVHRKRDSLGTGERMLFLRGVRKWNKHSWLLNNPHITHSQPAYPSFLLILKFRKAWTVSVSHFSCSVVSDSLWSHGLQCTRLPCPSLTPGACSNSWPLSRWYHPTISPSVIPFSSHLQSFPASYNWLIQMSKFFTSGGQSSFD